VEQNETHILVRNVQRLMRCHDLTLVQLSEKSGVSKSLLGYLVNYRGREDRHPSTKTVGAIASAFALTPWELMHPDLHIPGDSDEK
jgi:hypothetical protein